MKIARLASLMVLAVAVTALVAASAAFAGPEFKPGSGVSFTGTSGLSLLLANNGTTDIHCLSDASSGSIVSATLVGNVIVHFLNCVSKVGTGVGCPVSSKGISNSLGLILTETLHGRLGTILPTGVAGLLLLPATGKKFVTILGNSCTEETSVTGNLVGEISPLGKSQTTGKLTFTNPNPIDFDLTGGPLVKAELVAFGTAAQETTEESLTFTPAVEVT